MKATKLFTLLFISFLIFSCEPEITEYEINAGVVSGRVKTEFQLYRPDYNDCVIREDGKPGIRVRLVNAGSNHGTITDDYGYYSIDGLSEGVYTVIAESSWEFTTPSTTVIVKNDWHKARASTLYMKRYTNVSWPECP